ncbi:response regulator protein [Candidatus Magnetoovum chiemensis]|nr:response regulator protein [Candidatus Magnetoovum chiemensis]
MSELDNANNIKRLADYAMVFELMSKVTFYKSERTAIDNIVELLRNLCAPKSIIYVSIIDDKPSEIVSVPERIDIEDAVTALIKTFNKEDYSWTPSGQGFRLRIKNKMLMKLAPLDKIS